MIKERITISVISALCGAGLMLLALGTRPPSGITGWSPVNEAMAASVQVQQATDGQAGHRASASVSPDKTIKAAGASAVPVEPSGAASPPISAGKSTNGIVAGNAAGLTAAGDGPDAVAGAGAGAGEGDERGSGTSTATGHGAYAAVPSSSAVINEPASSADHYQTPATVVHGASSDGISINSAGSAELQEIPGIGEKKAQAILDYRNQHGAFRSLEDLKKVKGIGDKMFEKMRPYIGL